MSAAAVAGVAYGLYINRFPSGSHPETATVWNPWKVQVYRWLPLRRLSRVWGKVNSYELPPLLRRPILGFYVRWYKCNLNEAEQTDLRSYVSLQDFFCRSVRPELRPISQEPVVAPGDGVVQWCGPLDQNRLVQVKGISYPLDEFFGRPELTDFDLDSKCRSLYSCIIYLAPGDYHGFHSPADWQVSLRRHISGSLLSVGQRISRRVDNLYCLNERVHLVGRWRHGFFSLCAVGATNVGSIRLLAFEDDLRTNRSGQPLGYVSDLQYEPVHQQRKGDKLGVFKLGSSIVLIFEAPVDFRFSVAAGHRVNYGQPLGHVGGQS